MKNYDVVKCLNYQKQKIETVKFPRGAVKNHSTKHIQFKLLVSLSRVKQDTFSYCILMKPQSRVCLNNLRLPGVARRRIYIPSGERNRGNLSVRIFC